jgi:hypothetical protein
MVLLFSNVYVLFGGGGEGDFLNAEGAKVSQRTQKEEKEYKNKFKKT